LSFRFHRQENFVNFLFASRRGLAYGVAFIISVTRANDIPKPLPAAVQVAYDAANEQIQFNTATLTYDANGNLTSDGTNTYTWDALNQVESISGPGLTASFEYDALGRRISRAINVVTTQFLYDGNDIVAEIGGAAVGATYLRSLNIDEMFGILRQDGAYFSIYDGIGSTLALTDQSGTPVVQYTYDPFGNTQSTNPAFPNPFQFTGRENDSTGLYYYRARYYAPLFERFVSDEPLNRLYFPGAERRSPIASSKFPPRPPENSTASFEIDLLTALAQGLTKRLPVPQLLLSGLGCGEVVGAPEILPAYAYVNNTPTSRVDPTGLGPPSECRQYENDCEKGLNIYSCLAIQPCKGANGVFGEQRGNCIRNCLLDEYRSGCASIACQVGAHRRCFSQCW